MSIPNPSGAKLKIMGTSFTLNDKFFNQRLSLNNLNKAGASNDNDRFDFDGLSGV